MRKPRQANTKPLHRSLNFSWHTVRLGNWGGGCLNVCTCAKQVRGGCKQFSNYASESKQLVIALASIGEKTEGIALIRPPAGGPTRIAAAFPGGHGHEGAKHSLRTQHYRQCVDLPAYCFFSTAELFSSVVIALSSFCSFGYSPASSSTFFSTYSRL